MVKKVVKTNITVTKTVTEQKKEKKVYSLPGQKHDPPEEVRAAISHTLVVCISVFIS